MANEKINRINKQIVQYVRKLSGLWEKLNAECEAGVCWDGFAGGPGRAGEGLVVKRRCELRLEGAEGAFQVERTDRAKH